MSLPNPPGRPVRPVHSRIIGEHRAIGDAPAIGPVARMQPGSCPHRRRRLPRQNHPHAVRRTKIPRWLIVSVGAICTVFIGLLFRQG